MDESSEPSSWGARLPTTLVMSTAAGVAALIAVFATKDGITWITVVFALAGLAPWVLEAAGTRVGPWLFVGMAMLPAAAISILDRNPGGLFPAMIAVVSLTHRCSGQAVVAAALCASVAMTIVCGILQPWEFDGTIYFLGGIGVSWFAGTLLNRQETLVAELREATERERCHAASEERTRIAREVHDVIAHSLTVTLLHVTGARRALLTDPHRAGAALERAELVGRESLDSIRQVVGLLRDAEASGATDERADDTPLPQFSDLPSLVAQYRDAGLRVDASLELDAITAGAMTSLTVFRLVQEAMTNSLQHAPGAPVSLSVRPGEARDTLLIMVENPLRDASPRDRRERRQGLGLTGMAERVRAAGGSIDIGPTTRGTWRVTAELPLDRAKESL